MKNFQKHPRNVNPFDSLKDFTREYKVQTQGSQDSKDLNLFIFIHYIENKGLFEFFATSAIGIKKFLNQNLKSVNLRYTVMSLAGRQDGLQPTWNLGFHLALFQPGWQIMPNALPPSFHMIHINVQSCILCFELNLTHKLQF